MDFMLVRDRMTTSLVWIRASSTLRDGQEVMKQRGVRHLLVRDDAARLIGIVSDRDLRLIQPSRAWQEPADVDLGLWSLTIEQSMTRDIVVTSPEATLADAAALMLDKRIGALPVVANDTVVGIISETDLLEVVAQRAPHPAIFRALAQGTPLSAVREQLVRCRTVAVVGLTGDTGATPELETSKLLSFDITVYPIHDRAQQLFGLRCYPSLAAVPGAVDVVDVFPGGRALDLHQLVNDTIRKRAKVFWYEGPELPKDVVELLRIEHISVVSGHSLQAELFNVRS
jgi:CBS domain-containing protein